MKMPGTGMISRAIAPPSATSNLPPTTQERFKFRLFLEVPRENSLPGATLTLLLSHELQTTSTIEIALFGEVCVFFNIYNFIHLFSAVLGLPCCVGFFSSCDEQGLLSNCYAPASHCSDFSCRAWALRRMEFSSCGSWALKHRLHNSGAWAQLLLGTWDLPRPQGSNPCPLPQQADSLPLNHQGSLRYVFDQTAFKKTS